MAEEFTLFIQHFGVIIGHSWKYNYWSFMETRSLFHTQLYLPKMLQS